MNTLRAALLAALALAVSGITARAQDVTLTARDGSVEISGTLLTFDGEFYRVDTDYGILTVDGSGVNCDGPACPTLGTYVAELVISGTRAMGEVLMPALIEGFALRQGYALSREEDPDREIRYTLYEGDGGVTAARIAVRLTSSAEGFADLLGEQSDMALSLREVTADERRAARDAGLGDLRSTRQGRVLALDALVPVVAPGNPVARITPDQLAAVFAGEITRWSELGGEDAPITLHIEDTTLGFGDLFARRVLDARGLELAPGAEGHPSLRSVVEAVTGDPFSIGIAAVSQPGAADVLTLSGVCAFDVAASPAAIKAGDYPMTAPMYLYLPARRLPRVGRDLLAYLRSPAAQLVIQRTGFVDQALTTVPVSEQGLRLSNAIRVTEGDGGLAELRRMAETMSDAGRLTLSFRFEGGSTALDGQSQSNVALLASALDAGWLNPAQVTFVGFSDGQGDAAVNQRLALRRARNVRSAVMGAVEQVLAEDALAVDAFGEAMPMACDDSDWGRRVNRRVEVWIDRTP